MPTRSQLLEWFYRQGTGARYQVLLKEFGPGVEQALDGLIELGIVFDYTRHDKTKKNQMFKVSARWSKALELNSGQGGYRLRKSKNNNGESSRETRVFVKTAKGRYVLALPSKIPTVSIEPTSATRECGETMTRM